MSREMGMRSNATLPVIVSTWARRCRTRGQRERQRRLTHVRRAPDRVVRRRCLGPEEPPAPAPAARARSTALHPRQVAPRVRHQQELLRRRAQQEPHEVLPRARVRPRRERQRERLLRRRRRRQRGVLRDRGGLERPPPVATLPHALGDHPLPELVAAVELAEEVEPGGGGGRRRAANELEMEGI